MSEVLVSVIIPVYNSEELLSRCLDSVCNQTLEDIEIICVDDGSSDNSYKLLKEYESKDDRVVVLSQSNSGAGIARNKGMDIARGEYIAFVDSDDWIEIDALEKLCRNIKSNGSDMVLFNSIEHKPDDEFKCRVYLKDEGIDYNNFTFDYTYRKNFVMNGMLVVWSKFYKTSFLKENNIRFYNHEIFNDVQFHIQSMLLAKEISYLPEILYHYRNMGQKSLQTSRAVTRKGFILFDIFDEIEGWLKENGFFEEFETNYYMFLLTESQGRLEKTDEAYKDELFPIIREKFLKIDISTENLKKTNIRNYRFYIHVLNSNSYFEYKRFLDSTKNKNSDLSLSYLVDEKDKEVNRLNKLSISYLTNPKMFVELIRRIKKYNLFDESFYSSHYDCENLDPLIHYLYKGYHYGNKPNAMFDSDHYARVVGKKLKDSGLDPFFYFVLYGMDEGAISLNDTLPTYVRCINKQEIAPKIKKFTKLGITNTSRTPRLIVSLTSFPERMYDIHFCLYSILNQEVKPDKVILWLSKEQFPNSEKDIPQEVLSLKENGLEIKWCEEMGSYKKFIPAFIEYPDDVIVTADDDLYYHSNWLKMLYEAHVENPNDLIAHRARRISFNENGSFKDYVDWELIWGASASSYLNFSTNGAGTLFPPNSLNSKVLDYNLANKLCSTSDDAWIWVMALLNETKIKVVYGDMAELTYVNPAREINLFGEKTLWSINSQGDNDDYLRNMIAEFPEILDIIGDER